MFRCEIVPGEKFPRFPGTDDIRVSVLYTPRLLTVEDVADLEIVGALRIDGADRSVPTRLAPA